MTASDDEAPTASFEATVHKQGPNAYVDIPASVTRAFSAYAAAGRNRVLGDLNGVPVNATLVPVGRKGQRLYVNGGMRSAARVGVGDTVRFDLRPTREEDVTPSEDLAAALAAQRARPVFDALSPSNRRQLLRFIDDARTPQSRAKRVAQAVDHVLGRPRDLPRLNAGRPLWTCPNCGNQFVNRNQYHSCATHTLDTPFAGKPPRIRDLFASLREAVEACGPVKFVPYHDRVSFMVRVRFAGAAPKTRWLEVGVWLRRRVERPLFHRIETISPDVHWHVTRITGPEQIDALASLLCEAYAVGAQHARLSPAGPR